VIAAQTRLMPLLDESEAIDQVLDRLTERFPDVPVETVRRTVSKVHDDLDGPVRTYVPLLVEHDARDVLRSARKSVRVAGGTPPRTSTPS